MQALEETVTKNEETRKTNESERIANEDKRKLAEKSREKITTEAVNNIKDLSASYEQLAKEKETELNTHKTTLETEMTNTKDALVQEIKTAQNGFDENVTTKTTEFNNNATSKTTTFNNNYTTKTNSFNTNATNKTNEFNTNAETKTNDFNTNASTKKTEYDDNATAKLEEYNSNATAKVNEFNENAESYEKRIADLEQERDEVAQQMPWNTTDVAESIHVEDSAKYSRNKLDVFGNLNQNTREGYNKLNVLEENSAGITKTVNEVTYTFNEDGTISLNGTATSNVYISLNTKLNIANGGSILTKILKGTVTGNITLAIYDENLENSRTNTLVSKETSILRKDIVYCKCRLVVFKDAVVNNLVLGNMILDNTVQQSKTEIEYEQYGAMPSIEYPSMPVTTTGVQKIKKIYKNIFDGEVEIGGLNLDGSLNSTSDRWRSVNYVNVKKIDNVTITLSNKTFSSVAGRYLLYNANKELIHNAQITSNNFVIDTSNASYLKFWILINIADITTQVQIEEGDTATNYEPYKEEVFELDLADTELCKITDTNGNVVAQDRAVYREVDGVWKWQWEKNITKIIIDETQTISTMYESDNTERVQYNNILSEASEKYRMYAICNMLLCKIVWNGDFEGFYLDTNKKGIILRINKNIIGTTKESINEYFSNNNLVIYYILATPKYEDCTAEQSEVLDKLHKLQLEQGTNNIFVESENGVTTELQLTYMQDNNLIREQEHKALEDRITELEAMILSNASEEV